MPSPDKVLTFALASLLLIVVPGPSVLFVVSRALAYGRRVALTTVVGNTLGAFTVAAAVAAGVGAVVQTSATLYTVIKLAGAAYLIYLGVRAFRHRRDLRAALEAEPPAIRSRRTLWEGYVVGVTNPKAAVFFAAILPQFISPERGHASLQMLLLGGLFALIALIFDGLWGLAAGTVRAWLARSAQRLELVGGAAGLTMVGLGVGVAVSGRT